MRYFFLDAETDGLYGAFLSVAALAADEAGNEIEHFYGAVRPEKAKIQSPWVLKHVAPQLQNADTLFDSEDALLEAFWCFWMKYREGAACIADVCCPVEARLFSECVTRALPEREFLGPYPLFDLSTLLLARGIDPDASRRELAQTDISAHDAMNDVRMLSLLWRKYA